MTTETAIEKLTETDPMRRNANKGLMVHWINADLMHRHTNDVRYSVVFYDEDKLFLGAMRADDPDQMMSDIATEKGPLYAGIRDSLARDGVRYWSVGIV